MRALRVVGLTEDGDVVLEDPVRLERYTVAADERLRAAARGDLSRLGQIAIELESQLRPREIQARIRAGASVEQVATAAGVPEQKIERFAYPVLLERFRTADNAQRAHPVRTDGPDSRTLAEVVAHTFGLRGQTYEGARWDSWKGEDGRWVVALSWRAGRSDNRAHWTFQPGAHGGTVTALDEHASDLVEGLPARPLRTVGAVVDMTRPEEEPPPPPAPEQWRAAASGGYRERMTPDRPTPGGTRTASEPWRPGPPAQRQAEPTAEPWTRPVEPRPEVRAPEVRTPEPRTPEPRPARDDVQVTGEWAPWDRAAGADRGAASRPEAAPTATAPAPTAVDAATDPGLERAIPVARGATARPVAQASTHTPTAAAQQNGDVRGGTAPVVDAPALDAPALDAPALDAPALDAPADVEPATAEPAAVPTADRPAAPGPTAQADDLPAVTDGAADTGSPESAPSGTAPTDTPPTDTPPTDTAPTDTTPGGSATPEPGSAEPAAETATPDTPEEPEPAATPAEPAASAPDVAATDAPAPPAPAAAPNRRTKKGKPVMPSWDEVLLGVRGPR